MSEFAFFITGMGRSGTKWLATLLNEAEGIQCHHEPIRSDANTYGRIYRTPELARGYLRERKEQMERMSARPRFSQPWGEVNSYLRYCAPTLREVFNVPVLGLVRDGKQTVQSLLRRRLYVRAGRPPIPPPREAGNRFAKCCWYWVDTYERLLEQEVDIFKLEALNESYTAFEMLCEELGIEIPEKVWKRYADRHIHMDRRSRAAWKWTRAQERTFEHWAGDIYRELGYAETD